MSSAWIAATLGGIALALFGCGLYDDSFVDEYAYITQSYYANFNTNTYGNPRYATVYTRAHQYDSYIQDEWRVRPDITLNAGLRWEFNQPIVDNSPVSFPNQRASFIPGRQSKIFPTAPVGIVYPGDPGVGAERRNGFAEHRHHGSTP